MIKRNDKTVYLILISFCIILISSFLLIELLKNKSYAYTADSGNYQIFLKSGTDLVANSTNDQSMRNNTATLQNAINLVSDSGGGVVYIPAGTFYFSIGGISLAENEEYAIKLRNNVKLSGAGTNESNSSQLTILKPYYYYNDYEAYYNNKFGLNLNIPADGGMDMFYFNNYAESLYNNGLSSNVKYLNVLDMSKAKMDTISNQTLYLQNADFEDFIIDAENTNGKIYDTSGKGFMINLFENCDWKNVVVKNTDATGFGMDCPINSTIDNCAAINCGKKATTSNQGASGFGIGTGYSNNEYIQITNSVAINNKKFGFFFEHQGKFTAYNSNTTNYPATTSKGFIVHNSSAGGNMSDFGGLKAYNVTYDNIKNISGYYRNVRIKATDTAINFGEYSSNIKVVNSNISNTFNDVSSIANEPSFKWALNTGITNGRSAVTFAPNATVSKYEAAIFMYRMEGLPESLNSVTNKMGFQRQKDYYISLFGSNYIDLNNSNFYYGLDAVYWLYKKNVISDSIYFYPSAACTRADIITWLFKLAGSPSVNVTLPYSDVTSSQSYYNAVKWAYYQGILNNSLSNFGASTSVTRYEIISYLYAYTNRKSGSFSITCYAQNASNSNCPSSYSSGNSIIINALSKNGYTFEGWVGSNGNTPSKTVTVSSNARGNLAYNAIFTKNDYSISYNLNGGSLSVIPLSNYNIESRSYTLPSPQKNGYTFTGWTGSGLSSPQKNVVISKGSTGNKSFTANFASNSPDVSISSIKIQNLPTKTTYNINEKISLSGLKILVNYNNSTSTVISSGFSTTPANETSFSTSGEKTIIVSYGEKTASFKININEPSVSSISINQMPTKTTYNINEKISLSGLKIKVNYNNSTSTVISSGFSTTPANETSFSTTGEKTIIVSYEGKTVSFNMTVKPSVSSISINQMPTKTIYNINEKISLSGLKIKVNYNNSTSTVISSGFSTTPANETSFSTSGEKSIIVNYEGKSAYFKININKPPVSSISIKEKPSKTDYYKGEPFLSSGLVIEVKRSNGATETIKSGFELSIKNNAPMTKVGDNVVVVSYENKTTSFKVNVKSIEINSIIIKTLPKKIKYYEGETFNSLGLSLLVKRSNGTTETITEGFELSIRENTILNEIGKQEVTVKYGNVSDTFEIEVIEMKISNIIIKSIPIKTEYYIGEKFDTKGLEVFANDANGNKILIKDYTLSITDDTVLNKIGSQEVIITYKDKTAKFNITILDNSHIEVSIYKLPQKTKYYNGEAFSIYGLELLIKQEGQEDKIEFDGYTVSIEEGTILENVGVQTVVIDFNGQSIAFEIVVKNIIFKYIIIAVGILLFIVIILLLKKWRNYCVQVNN